MKVLNWLDRNFEQVLVSFFTIGMVLTLVVNVVMRFIFGASFTVAEELSRFLFLWAVFWAGSLAAQKNAHIRVTVFTDHFSKRIRNWIEAVADAIWLCFNGIVSVEGFKLVASMFEFPFISPGLGWSMAYVYAIIPLSFTAMSFRILQRYYRIIRYGWRMADVGTERADL
jgi:C4-dicarboxylate transporter DctQ subunit